MREGSHYVAPMARSYSVDEAQLNLHAILRRVKQGRSVIISERGRAIAQVVPIDASTNRRTGLESLEETGQLTRGAGHLDAIRPIADKPGAVRRFLRSR